MRDFLDSHNLMPEDITNTAPIFAVLPMSTQENLSAMRIANEIRQTGLSVAIDTTDRKIGKKIAAASTAGSVYFITVGEDEVASDTYTMKHLETGKDTSGTIKELLESLTQN